MKRKPKRSRYVWYKNLR